jgi:hypothetical protein
MDSNLQLAFQAVASAMKLRIAASEKGAVNGVATLDGTGKVPVSQLPIAASLGAVVYQGVWDASTNIPTIPAASAGNKGYYYKVSVGGTTVVDTIAEWAPGDWIISNGTVWDKTDNTETVSSVAGKTGAIRLNKADVSLDYVDNTADADKNVLSATTLTTARTINDVSFDGSANINIEGRLGTAIASAATTTIGTLGLGETIHITGTTNITSFGTAAQAGVKRIIVFDGALVLTHDTISLICPGAANITTLAGTTMEVVAETTGNWRIISVQHPSVNFAEVSYLAGVTSSIQTQINAKADGSALSTLITNVGATNTDYVALFTAAMVEINL